jgi:zinc protease
LTRTELISNLEEALGRWRANERVPPAARPAAPPVGGERLRTYLVNRPDAVQTVMRFIMPAPPYADPNRVKLELLDTLFGGSFTSRLNQNLRERHGYTYGAGSSLVMDPSVGYFVVATSVETQVTGAALRECLREFDRIRSGDITEAEAAKTRATVRNRAVESFAGLEGVLETAATLELNGLPFSTVGKELQEVASTTCADLNAIVREALPVEKGVLLLVGDRTAIVEQLKDLGLTIDGELTVTGTPVEGN